MKRVVQWVLYFLALPAMGTHIVGGEFEIRHLDNYQYRVYLNIYFDVVNGDPTAQDATADVRIFRKRDNARMRDLELYLVDDLPVSYTQPACTNDKVITKKLIYRSAIITLSPDLYNDPDGYYIAWQRCCRNYSISNIYSLPPDINRNFAGQTFYLEFPSVTRDGMPFVNSTPRLFPPLSDYACPDRPYYADFAGFDDDGDSLAYSLVEPLNTHTGAAVPRNGPRPAPYPTVRWRSPFGINNIMAGNPDLKINEDGFLTVKPTLSGLFVFAVRCEEFRDGVKIGEVRRDFQLYVLSDCPIARPPQILGKKLTDANYTYDNTMSVTFSNSVTDEDRCIMVRVSDPDASSQDQDFEERIRIKAIPIGFKKDVSGILPDITSATLKNGSTVEFPICFDKCPLLNGPFQVGILAYDDACALPLFDTLKVTVNIQPPANAPPQFVTPGVTETIDEGDFRSWTIEVVDAELDPMVLGFIPVGFTPAQYGMSFQITHQENGKITARLDWDARCDVYDFSDRTNFQIILTAEDMDECLLNNGPIQYFNLAIRLPGNQDPVIDSDLTADPRERLVEGLTRQVYESISFNVTGSDADNDFIVLNAQGVDFDINDLDITFNEVQGTGAVTSPFTWNISCSGLNLDIKDTYQFRFVVIDRVNKCRVNNQDTLDVVVQILPADNQSPDLTLTNLNPIHTLANGALAVNMGEQIELGLFAVDPDNVPAPDHLRIDLIDARGTVPPQGYVFTPGEGEGAAETTFSWLPDCSIFRDDVYTNEYQFTFRVYDSRCFNVLADTVAVDITIKDVESDLNDFLPPNIITPNDDNCNDYFAMEGIDPIPAGDCMTLDPDGIIRLPKDNCIRHFESVRVYNRWGELVFESNDREFRWYAKGNPNGVYYYVLKFSDKEFKSSITVRF
jgi:hypothetical protein